MKEFLIILAFLVFVVFPYLLWTQRKINEKDRELMDLHHHLINEKTEKKEGNGAR